MGQVINIFLPLVFWENGVVVIVSPLRAIMSEQQERLQDLGINSICLMRGAGDITVSKIADLKKGKYRAVFMTPEIMFENELLRALWYDQHWNSQLLEIVIDEAHCIHT